MTDFEPWAVDRDALLERSLQRGNELIAQRRARRRVARAGRVGLVAAIIAASVTVTVLATSRPRPVRTPTVSPVRHFTPLAITSTEAPSPRMSPAVAYFPPDHEVVLFGGDTPDTGGKTYPHGLGDTWVFDAHGWHELHPKHSPPPRNGGLLIYDPATHLLMLFGGYSARFKPTTVLSDTWAWNGTDWTRLHPARVPTWMPGAPTAFDPTTGYVTELAPRPGYPGSYAPVATFNGDNGPVGRWVWTGRTWLYRSEDPAPSMNVAGGAFVTDPLSGGMLLFTYNFPSPSCPTACHIPPDPTGTRYSETWLWNGKHFTKEHPSRAPTSSALVVGDARISRSVVVDTAGHVWSWSGATWTRLATPKGPAEGGVAVYDVALGDVIIFGTATYSPHPTSQTWLWNGSRWIAEP